jgi:hypothetical protein
MEFTAAAIAKRLVLTDLPTDPRDVATSVTAARTAAELGLKVG